MALIDTLGAAQRGATAGVQNYGIRLAGAQAANQVASDAVQRELDRQRILRSTGVTPRTASADVFAAQATPEFKPIGGEVTPATVQQKRTNYTGFKPPIYSAAPVPPGPVAPAVGLTPPGATPVAPATALTGEGLMAEYGPRIRRLPLEKQDQLIVALSAVSTLAETQAVLETFLPKIPAGAVDYYPNVDVFNPGADASPLAVGTSAIGNFLYNAPGDIANFSANYLERPIAQGFDRLTLRPSEYNSIYAEPEAVPAAAETTAAETTAAETAGTETAAQRSGYETAVYSDVGLTTPPTAEQQADEQQQAVAGLTEDTVDPNLPPEYASRNARMRMTPEGMEWRGQQFMAERESITQAINQATQLKQYAYQVGTESRNRQYDSLIAQARDAATAGNTAYAQTLMTQAETILQQADDADIQIRNDMAMIRAEANSAYSKSDMDLWLHQATIAEQEFMRGNNPSRMLSIMEAMGNPTEIEDAGRGLYRIRHPAEDGSYIYERDSSGKVLEVPNTGVSDYMMRMISEERTAQDIANQAAAAALQSEREFELLKITVQSKADIAEAFAEAGLKQDEYTWTQLDDGSLAAQPKAGGPLKIVTRIPQDGDKPARVTVVEVPL